MTPSLFLCYEHVSRYEIIIIQQFGMLTKNTINLLQATKC